MFLAEGAWSFDLSQFDSVWKFALEVVLLLIFLLIGNLIRRVVPFLRKAFIPSALLGGLLLLGVSIFFDKVLNFPLFDARHMQIITYHSLAIGFIAMSLKAVDKSKKQKIGMMATQNGMITGGTYMLQAVLGLGVSLLFFALGAEKFYGAGVILPLGFGQGPGNALTWDINFTNMLNAEGAQIFFGEGSFGLTIASVGFIVASVVGVTYIEIFKKKGQIKPKTENLERKVSDFEDEDEIEDSESVDKTSIQIALVALCYVLAFGIMFLLAKVSEWTGIAVFNSIAWGFNFIFGVLTATLVKALINFFRKKNIIKKQYINNYQMDRISGFAFDLMIIAGVAAIDINIVKNYALLITILCLVGTVATLFYVRLMTKLCFKDFAHEAFLVNFGTLTGTAYNGMILLREVDPNFETPTADIYILSQFTATLCVAPLLFLLNMCGKSLTGCFIALGIFLVLFGVYTTFLVLTSKGIIFKGKKKETVEETK